MTKFLTLDDPVVPVHHPRVIVETAAALGADRSDLMSCAGLSAEALENPEARISHRQYGALISRALETSSEPALGLLAGKKVQLPQMGPLGLALMSSATIGDALEMSLRHAHVLSPSMRLELERDEGGELARLTIREILPSRPFEAFAHEMVLAAFDSQGRMLSGGKPLPVRRLRFAFAKPAHGDRYKEFYDVPMTWDQPVTSVEFDASLLLTPIGSADPATAKIASRICDERLPPENETAGVVERTRQLFDAAHPQPPNLERLARSMHVSGRTLRRALQRVGTSYQRLLDEWRRERADEWMRVAHLSPQQMAKKLGFSDVRSFRRAYKRWTGHSPNVARTRQ